MNYKLLDDAVASALCPMFQAIVPATSTIAVVAPIFGPSGVAAAMTAAKVAGLSMLGASATCPEVEIGPDPVFPTGDCTEVDVSGQLQYKSKSTSAGGIGDTKPVKKILAVEQGWLDPVNQVGSISVCTYLRTDGSTHTTASGNTTFEDTIWYIVPDPGSTCISDTEPVAPSNPAVPDHIYTDPVTTCNYTVKFEGFLRETIDGPIQPVFQISSQLSTRTGGRMGGCNLSPVIHVSPPNGPGGPGGPRIPPIPVPDNPPDPFDGVPWWAGPLLAGATGAALTLIGQELAKLTEPVYDAGTFTLTAPCDYTEEGDKVTYFFPFPKAGFQQRVLDHQMAILDVLQYQLNSKTPICRHEKPQLEGTWISTRWISDGNSPGGERPLRKLFRYRSKSTRTAEQLREYWADYTWQAGSVCVIHKGAWWGTPQVWAATAEEGQRVIRFAGAEAGIDPDQTGEWAFSSSDSPRYGMPGTMRLEAPNGTRWVTRRDGPSGVPV